MVHGEDERFADLAESLERAQRAEVCWMAFAFVGDGTGATVAVDRKVGAESPGNGRMINARNSDGRVAADFRAAVERKTRGNDMHRRRLQSKSSTINGCRGRVCQRTGR